MEDKIHLTHTVALRLSELHKKSGDKRRPVEVRIKAMKEYKELQDRIIYPNVKL